MASEVVRKSADALLEEVMDLLIEHIATSTDEERPKAVVEAVAVTHVAESAMHGATCTGGTGHPRGAHQFCPREGAEALAGVMLDDLHGALARAFGTTGYVQ